MIFQLLFVFTGALTISGQCLNPSVGWINEVLKLEEDRNCVTVLLGLNTSIVAFVSSISNNPLMVIGNQNTKSIFMFKESLSSRNARCVIVFACSVTVELMELMLVETRYRKIFLLNRDGMGLEKAKKSTMIDDVILVTFLRSGDAFLESQCFTSDIPKTMLWRRKKQNQNYSKQLCVSTTLKGRKDISASVNQLFPFVVYLPNHRYAGAEVQIFNILSAKVGFKYVIREESVFLKKNPVTKKWEGIVGSVINGSSEFGFSGIAIKRPEDSSTFPLDFSPLLYTIDTIYLSPKPQPLSPFLNFLKPFSWPVWASVFGALLLCAISSTTMVSYRQRSKYFEKDLEMTFGDTLLELYGAMFSQILKDRGTSSSSRIFYLIYGVWTVALFFKTSAYNCNLRAFIVKVDYEKPIETDEDLVRLNRDAYFVTGSFPIQYYTESPLPIKRNIIERAISRGTVYDLVKGDMPLSVQQRMVREGACRVSLASRASFLLTNTEAYFGYQPLRASKTVILNWGAAFVMPMYKPWSDEINQMLLRINNAGIVDHLIDSSTPRNKYTFPEVHKGEEELQPYRVEHVAGSLIFLAVGLSVSLIVFSLEHLQGNLMSRERYDMRDRMKKRLSLMPW